MKKLDEGRKQGDERLGLGLGKMFLLGFCCCSRGQITDHVKIEVCLGSCFRFHWFYVLTLHRKIKTCEKSVLINFLNFDIHLQGQVLLKISKSKYIYTCSALDNKIYKTFITVLLMFFPEYMNLNFQTSGSKVLIL